MAEIRLTLALEGEVSLDDFATSLSHWRHLLEALRQYTAHEAVVHWDIGTLEASSAITTILGTSLDSGLLHHVEDSYMDIGRHLQRRSPLPYPLAVMRPALQLTHVINGRVTAIRFQTDTQTIRIHTRVPLPEYSRRTHAFGSIRGVVETLQRRRHRFILYDELFDAPVRCRIHEGQEELLRGVWGKAVEVVGEIGRDAQRQVPIEVRDIWEIRVLPDAVPAGYLRARGVVDFGTETPEILLRRLRDAE